jgi:GNAT superfamily N-acetyltransferase
VEIRKASLADASASFDIRREAIHAQCVGHYPADVLDLWTAGTMSEAFALRVADHFHVAVVGEQVVGTGMIDLATGKIDAVFVLPGYMGRGIGRALMAHLESLAVSEGLGQLELESTLNAAPFYRGLGYEGESVSVYRSSLGVSLACIPMVKRLR